MHLFDALAIVDVDARPDVTGELALRSEARQAFVEHPVIRPVVTREAVLDAEAVAPARGGAVDRAHAGHVVRVDVVVPALAELLLHRAARELEPAAVEVRAAARRVGHPDEGRDRVREAAEPFLALTELRLGALPFGDLQHDGADPERAAVLGHDRVGVDEPRALLAGQRGRDPRRIGAQRLARLQHAAQGSLDAGVHLRQDLRHRPADVVGRGHAVDLGERLVDPDVPQVGVEEREARGRRREERVEEGQRLGRLAEEPRVVDGERGPARQLGGECQVLLAVHPSGLGREQRDRSQRPSARDERHRDQGARLDVDVRGQALRVGRVARELRRGQVRDELRLGVADDAGDADVGVGIEGMPFEDGADALGLPAGVLHGEPLDRPVRTALVDDAPVRDGWDGEPGDVAQGRVDVQRAGELLARPREEAEPLLGAQALGELGLRLLEQEEVVDRERGPFGELQRERQILLVEPPPDSVVVPSEIAPSVLPRATSGTERKDVGPSRA